MCHTPGNVLIGHAGMACDVIKKLIHAEVNRFGGAKPLNLSSVNPSFCQKLSDKKGLF
jgi:hypothetical protein